MNTAKPLTGKKVLIVDDEEMLREVIAETMTRFGAEVYEAGNGVVAFDMTKEQNFDIIFTDIRMPGGDGITFIKKIKAELNQNPVIFLCTGFSDLARPDLLKLGVTKILEKPFDTEEVVKNLIKAS